MITQNTVSLFFQENNIVNNEESHQKYSTSNKTIDYVKNITYETFFTNYLMLNKPCIIALKDTKLWKSTLEWAVDGKPNFEFLEQEFGSCIVPVADCNVREYNSQKKINMVFKDYINYWCNLEQSKNSELLYLKDWHFKREFPDYIAYDTPEYFLSDWLNEFCKKQEDDYQFVYMGPKGTWTPLHSDVFGSYSWSINICGSKKWLLFPPGNENYLKDDRKQLPYMVDEASLLDQDIFHFEVIQGAQEIIFVPSGWHHQVWNLEDTISINHNWFNGCNIDYVWKCLYQAAIDVENEIADCKGFDGWEDQLQIILKAHHGMNYSDFLLILQSIVAARIEKLESSNGEFLNWHFIFDLLSIKHLCLKMESQVHENVLIILRELLLSIKKFLGGLSDLNDVLSQC